MCRTLSPDDGRGEWHRQTVIPDYLRGPAPAVPLIMLSVTLEKKVSLLLRVFAEKVIEDLCSGLNKHARLVFIPTSNFLVMVQ